MDGNRLHGTTVAPPAQRSWWHWLAAAGRALAKPVGARVAVVLALCAVTLYANFGGIRYETSISSIVPGNFARHWHATRWGVRLLRQDPSIGEISRVPDHPYSYIGFNIPRVSPAAGLRVSLDARTGAVVAGPEPWRRARVLVWSFDAAGNRLDYVPNVVLALDGTTDWTAVRTVIPFAPRTAWVHLVIANAGQAGSLGVRNLAVDAVVETPVYVQLRNLLIMLWVLAGAWALYPVVRQAARGPARVALAAIAVAVLAGVFVPQPTLDRAAHALFGGPPPAHVKLRPVLPGAPQKAPTAQAPAPAPPSPASPGSAPAETGGGLGALLDWRPAIDFQVGHVFGFAALAFALVFAFASAPVAGLFAGLLLLGGATECVQSFYISRTAEWIDFGRDALGAASGLALALLWLRLRQRRAMGHNPIS